MSTSTLTRARTRFPSAVLVAVGLAAGFGVAQGTGVRALGGAVFAARRPRRGLAVGAAARLGGGRSASARSTSRRSSWPTCWRSAPVSRPGWR